MPFTPTYSNTFAYYATAKNKTVDYSNPSVADQRLYSMWDKAIQTAYGQAETLLGQPIIQKQITHIWGDQNEEQDRRGKYVLPYHTVPLVSPTLFYRITPFNNTPWVQLTQDLDYVVENRKEGWAVFKRIIGTDFKLTATVGYTDATMPTELLVAVCELAQQSIDQTDAGAGRLGKRSVGTSSAAGNNTTTFFDISTEWLNRFGKYRVQAI